MPSHDPFKTINDEFLRNLASHVLLESEISALRAAIEEIAGKVGVELNLEDRVDRYRERLLVELENKNPALAALLQQMIDEAKKKSG